MTKTKGEKKNVSIITTITGLAGFGFLKLIEYAGQAMATGTYEPTVAFFQGAIGLLVASGIGLYYARTGNTSLPLDDKTIQHIVEESGKKADDVQNEYTE